jgi:hypothetical protein
MSTIATVLASSLTSSSIVNGIDTDAVHELIDNVDLGRRHALTSAGRRL